MYVCESTYLPNVFGLENPTVLLNFTIGHHWVTLNVWKYINHMKNMKYHLLYGYYTVL